MSGDSDPQVSDGNSAEEDYDSDPTEVQPASPQGAVPKTEKGLSGESDSEVTHFEGDLPAQTPQLSKSPHRVGRYRIERTLGEGGFGRVYLGHDDELERAVAIKVPRREVVSGPDAVGQYLKEARTVAALEHPYIVPVYDVGQTDEFPVFVVSRFVPGTDLAERMKAGPVEVAVAVELTATIAEALQFAHSHGVFHRDVKPANILLAADGTPWLTDFGLALRDLEIGQGSGFCGTPAYMSPEQAQGEGHRIDGRSDVFSLGIVFYELLTGRRPFAGRFTSDIMHQIKTLEARPPRQIRDRIPRELERICLKTLAKRASDRYQTAADFAEDLRCWLQDAVAPGVTPQVGPVLPSSGSPTPRLETPANTAVQPADADSASGTSDSRPSRIVPRGLQSFDANDADFFLELLPGPRDRHGLPDSVRFWKARIEEFDPDETFPVGLIYGPSGCGKSSLVKAGLLPQLSEDVIPVYVEATPDETESRLLHGLRKRCPALEDSSSLKDALAALRRGQSIPAGRKIVIVLDQFEQWLHARKEEEDTELVQTLRQCDGGRVQCLVMVRDDFWMAVTRFLRELEVKLLEGHNIAVVDLFPIRHAKKVLAAFGRAFGTLPDGLNEATREQQDFLEQAVAGLAEEGKVICVRLALFAEMMKGRTWAPATLKDVGGTKGVGVAFLEDTFSSSAASPEHRYHQKAARAVLKSLLPDSGTDIKGHMRSVAELLDVSGYDARRVEFDDLIRILDSEIRVITPTDPAGRDVDEDSVTKAEAGEQYYQLTHDYLVPSLREWLTRKQQETRRGRAELKLSERSALWNARPENRYLPSVWEWLRIRTLTKSNQWTDPQRTMMHRARRVHTRRWGSGLAVTLCVLIILQQYLASARQENLRERTVTAVSAMSNSRSILVPHAIDDLRELPREMVQAELRRQFDQGDPSQQLSLTYALAVFGDVRTDALVSQVSRVDADELPNLLTALQAAQAESTVALETAIAQAGEDWSLRARLAVLALHLGRSEPAGELCALQEDPTSRTLFIDELRTWHGDLSALAAVTRNITEPPLRSAILLGVGGVAGKDWTGSNREPWISLASEWYTDAPDTTMHSAAEWFLRRSEIALPPLTSSEAVEHKDWSVNSLGMTLLRLPAGTFRMGSEEGEGVDGERPRHPVTLSHPFLLQSTEVTRGQFQQFIDDPECPSAQKPEIWTGANEHVSSDEHHPVQEVSWFDAVLFCNWLSRRENRSACYQKSDGGDWVLSLDADGYRLPTEAEWEYACRAGTTTKFSCGRSDEQLKEYAVFSASKAASAGSRLPNGWGLYDMHGNVKEWCLDWSGRYPSGSVTDPTGAASGSSRMNRGGSWYHGSGSSRSAIRSGFRPDYRSHVLGFRVLRSSAEGMDVPLTEPITFLPGRRFNANQRNSNRSRSVLVGVEKPRRSNARSGF